MSQIQGEAFFEIGRGQDLGGQVKGSKSYIPIENEEPWHKMAITLFAKGWDLKDVAGFCDKETLVLRQLINTPWFAEKVAIEMTDEGASLSEIFKKNALSAAITLVELYQNPKTPATVRVSAANSILDRHLGKSTQHVEMKTESVSSNLVEENKALEAEVKSMCERQGLLS